MMTKKSTIQGYDNQRRTKRPTLAMLFFLAIVFPCQCLFANEVDNVQLYVEWEGADTINKTSVHVCPMHLLQWRVEWDGGDIEDDFDIRLEEETSPDTWEKLEDESAGEGETNAEFSTNKLCFKYGVHTVRAKVKYDDDEDEDKNWAKSNECTVYITDMHVRETARPNNRIPRNDPRQPTNARNKMLVWHNGSESSPLDEITFDMVKDSAFSKTIYYEITERENWNSDIPMSGSLTGTSTSKTFDIDHDHYSWEFKVDYGPSYDTDCTGPYEIYGVTKEDYDDAVWNFKWLYEFLCSQFANEIYKYWRTGTWDAGDYFPTSITGTATMGAPAQGQVTHIFGETFTSTGTTTINGVKYPTWSVTMPIYYWDETEATNNRVRISPHFKTGITKWVNDTVTYADIDSKWVGGDGTQDVTIEFSEDRPCIIEFGPIAGGTIWLGRVEINGTQWYGSGSVTLEVTKSGTTYSIAFGVDVDAIMEDVFDFNYFNSVPWGKGPEDGASIQCGWGQPGAITGTHSQAGHMGLVRIDVDGTCAAGPFDDKTP